jgi:hypothetical protein
MTSQIVIERKAGVVTDLESGKGEPVWEPVYGSRETPGKGWVRKQDMLGGALIARAAGNVEVFATATLHIPHDAPAALPQDIVTIIADDDPALVGVKLVVGSADVNSGSTARRFAVRHAQQGDLE